MAVSGLNSGSRNEDIISSVSAVLCRIEVVERPAGKRAAWFECHAEEPAQRGPKGTLEIGLHHVYTP